MTRCILVAVVLAGCVEDSPPIDYSKVTRAEDIAQISYGWRGELIAQVDESYAGWDVEIGDVDGDGAVEILTGTAPESQIMQFRHGAAGWDSTVLVDRLAGPGAGMVLDVRVVDLDGDGRPELIAGTGQEDGSVAQLAIAEVGHDAVRSLMATRASDNTSSYTHGLPTIDLDGDGMLEIVSSYCGNGEVIRYDLDHVGGAIHAKKVLQLSGSGENATVVDLDRDGRSELLVSNGYREASGRVQIHELDDAGNPLREAMIELESFEGERMFYASYVTGDLDGDGRDELVVAWKREQEVNRTTLVAYRIVDRRAELAYVLARDEPLLDMGYFEKMMAIADLDADGRNELVVSTRGDGRSEDIESRKFGHVFAYRIAGDGNVRRDLLVDFDPAYAESSWLDIGDVDGDGVVDLVLATGRGDRLNDGVSWVMRLWRDEE